MKRKRDKCQTVLRRAVEPLPKWNCSDRCFWFSWACLQFCSSLFSQHDSGSGSGLCSFLHVNKYFQMSWCVTSWLENELIYFQMPHRTSLFKIRCLQDISPLSGEKRIWKHFSTVDTYCSETPKKVGQRAENKNLFPGMKTSRKHHIYLHCIFIPS